MAIKVHKLAGIDVGSNSVRLLVSNVITDKEKGVVIFKKSSLTRLPVRLGPDSFEKGKISKKNAQKLMKSMQAYARIMEVHGVERYRACATSAMREAGNGVEIAQEIYEQTGVNIELIEGKEEARMIFNSEMIDSISQKGDTFLYIDVGGGSTEFTLFHRGKIKASQSFRIGTIRLLRDIVAEPAWEEMESWVREKTAGLKNILMVGSGGNINRTFKMSGNRLGEPLEKKYIDDMYEELLKYNDDDRMIKFDLNPDRSDVITHALRIYLCGMRWSGAQRMLVPKKGLADGIVRYLYREHYQPPQFQSKH